MQILERFARTARHKTEPARTASKTALERRDCKSRTTDLVIWLDVLLLVLGASTFAVILKLAGMEL